MADRFAALLKKPVPKKIRRRAINRPAPRGAVDIDVRIVDNTAEQDRGELLSKIRTAMIVKTKEIQQPTPKKTTTPQ